MSLDAAECHVCGKLITETGTGLMKDGKYVPVHIQCYHQVVGSPDYVAEELKRYNLAYANSNCIKREAPKTVLQVLRLWGLWRVIGVIAWATVLIWLMYNNGLLDDSRNYTESRSNNWTNQNR